MSVRLQKYLADAGVASRRASEKIIEEGRVSVNGKTVTTLGTKVDEAADRVCIDGKPLRVRRKLYVALNKPPGYICTRQDPEARKIILELLPREWSNLYSVGRLDCLSEGLLFLTNDGDFCLKLTHPRYGVEKEYLVTVEGRLEPEALDKLLKGVIDKGERLRVEKARLLSSSNARSLVNVQLREGKNREIRRLFQALSYQVERLVRIRIGPIRLGELPVGKWRVLTESEIKSLLSKI